MNRLCLADEEKQRNTEVRPFAFTIDSQVIEHIFASEFTKLDLSKCSESGARVFARWFIEVNLRLRTIEILDEQQHVAGYQGRRSAAGAQDVLVQYSLISRMERTSSRSKTGEVSSSEIKGLDCAWALATSGHSEKVADFATTLLSALHVQLSPELDKGVRQQLRGDFVKTCLERIEEVQKMQTEGQRGATTGRSGGGADGGVAQSAELLVDKAADNASLARRVQRCLSLLKSFLERQARHEEEKCEDIKVSAIIHGELSFRFKDCLLLSDAELLPSTFGAGGERSGAKASPRLAPDDHVLSIGASRGQVRQYYRD